MYDVRSDIYTYNGILIEPWKHISMRQHSSLIWEIYTVADKRLFSHDALWLSHNAYEIV